MKKLLDLTEKICLISMSVLLVAVVGILFYQVVSRYLFSSSSIWIEEFARFGNVWMSIILFGIVIRKEDNIRVDIIESIFKKNKTFLKWNALFVKGMELVFSVILLISILELIPAAKNRILPGMGFSMFYVYMSFVIGSILSVVYILEKIVLMVVNPESDKTTKEIK